jgi:hypothetical protein
MVNRRAFLRSLLALPIAATFDVEKLLWIPGQMVVVPSTYKCIRITLDEINAVALRMYLPAIEEFFKSTPLLEQLAARTRVRFDGRTIEVPIEYSDDDSDDYAAREGLSDET